MPAGVGAERRRDLVVLQRRDLATEVGAERILGEPAQVAALALRARVLRLVARQLGEVGAAGDARREGVCLGLGVSVRGGVVAADQNVAGLIFGDHARFTLRGIAGFHQLQQLEAAGASQRRADLARLHVADQVGERGRDLVAAAPAQVAAFQRVGAVGVTHRSRGEVHLALVEQRLHAFDLLLCGGDLLGCGAFGHRDQDVRKVELGTGVLLRRDGGIDLRLGDRDPALGETLAQALGQQLIADRIAKGAVRRAVAGDLLAQLLRGRAVLRGDVGDGLVDFLVGHPNAGLLGAGDLQLHQHQAFQHLLCQHIRWRQLGLAASVLGADVGHGAVELAAQDHVFVDHRRNAVDGLECGLGLQRHAGEGGHGEQARQ